VRLHSLLNDYLMLIPQISGGPAVPDGQRFPDLAALHGARTVSLDALEATVFRWFWILPTKHQEELPSPPLFMRVCAVR